METNNGNNGKRYQLNHANVAKLTAKLAVDSLKWSGDKSEVPVPKITTLAELYSKELGFHIDARHVAKAASAAGIMVRRTKRPCRERDQSGKSGVDNTARRYARDVGYLVRRLCQSLGVSEDGLLDFIDATQGQRP